MRKKELKLVVTFHTTADAMAMEKACKAEEVPGRLMKEGVILIRQEHAFDDILILSRIEE